MIPTRTTIALPFLLVLVAATLAAGQDEALEAALREYPHRIVFETNRDGNWELYLCKADGSQMKNLTNTADIGEVNPKASPDGRHIAFCADTGARRKRERDVCYMNVDGSGRKKIADDARDPCWSPDGKRIAYLPSEYKRFSTSTWATRGLRIYDLETGKTTVHPNDELEHLYTPTWTPDGKWFIATVHGGMGYNQAIIAFPVDGEAVHNLHLGGCRPDVTSDGKRVTWGYGDYALGVAELELGGKRPVTSGRRTLIRSRGRRRDQTYHADWSPEGRYILFSSGPKSRGRGFWGAMPQCPGVDAPGWNLCIADAEGQGHWIKLTEDGKSYKEPDWVPTPANEPR